MLRLLSVAFALFALGSLAAQAASTRYNDPNGRFNVAVPEGWEARGLTRAPLALAMISPRSAELGGVCLVLASQVPEMKSVPQAEIDAEFSKLVTPEFWKSAFQGAGIKDIAVEASGARDQNGRKIYYAVVSATFDGKQGAVRTKGKQEMHVIPGSIQFVMCTAKAEGYATLELEFESVFASYEPKTGEFVASAPQSTPSLLALFSGPRFDGFTRVLAQDTPDLGQLGWRGPTASLAVKGYGLWEVCEGANFAGSCRIVSAAISAGSAMRIGSVRRYLNPRDLRGAASLAGSTAGEQLKAAMERTAQGR